MICDAPNGVEVARRGNADAERARNEDGRVEGNAATNDIAEQAEEKRARRQAHIDRDEDVAGQSARPDASKGAPDVAVRHAKLELDRRGDQAEQLRPCEIGEEPGRQLNFARPNLTRSRRAARCTTGSGPCPSGRGCAQ